MANQFVQKVGARGRNGTFEKRTKEFIRPMPREEKRVLSKCTLHLIPACASQFKLCHDLARQHLQCVSLFFGELARNPIQYAERAESVTVRGYQGCSCIKPDMSRSGHERVRRKPSILA